MVHGMIMLPNNDDIRPRRNIIKVKTKKAWQLPTGHREDQVDTSFDNRPKRRRTRNDIDREWRKEYDM